MSSKKNKSIQLLLQHKVVLPIEELEKLSTEIEQDELAM